MCHVRHDFPGRPRVARHASVVGPQSGGSGLAGLCRFCARLPKSTARISITSTAFSRPPNAAISVASSTMPSPCVIGCGPVPVAARPISGIRTPPPIFTRKNALRRHSRAKGRLPVSKVAVRPPRWLRPPEERIPQALAVGVRQLGYLLNMMKPQLSGVLQPARAVSARTVTCRGPAVPRSCSRLSEKRTARLRPVPLLPPLGRKGCGPSTLMSSA